MKHVRFSFTLGVFALFLALSLSISVARAGSIGSAVDSPVQLDSPFAPPKRGTVTLATSLNSNVLSGSQFANGGNGVDWSNPGNAQASDNVRATAALQTSQATKNLKATGFGFAIPSDAVISGILVEVEHSESLPGCLIQVNQVKLIVAGTIQGNDNVHGDCLTTTDTYWSFGSSSDTWGLVLSPADINATNFGVAVKYFAMLNDTVRVDHIRITVYYSSRLYEESASQITYTGAGWTTETEARASGGAFKRASQAGNTACLSFTGADRVGIGRVVGTNQGKMRVTVNSTPIPGSPIDNYISYSDNELTTLHSFIWAKEGLTTGSHTICVEPDSNKNPASSSTQAGLDYFVISAGTKMALRGQSIGATDMAQTHSNAQWALGGVAGLVPNTSAAWNGFVPKTFGEYDDVTPGMVDQVIDGAVGQGAPVPAYWILLNESDYSHYGDFPPTDQSLHENLHDNIITIKTRYSQRGYTTPKFIIESGSQYHAPPGNQTWGADPECGEHGAYWSCQNPNAIWIDAFWTKFSAENSVLVADIAGFGGHYYQRADTNCLFDSCALLPNRVLDFTKALKNWAISRGLANKEIWLTETATWAWSGDCPGGETLAGQEDGLDCDDVTYNVRNYASQLQDALAGQGIVSRWAWFSDRYGGYHQCSQGGDNDTNYAVTGPRSDGELSALNASCTGVSLSPFGVNFSQAATYR